MKIMIPTRKNFESRTDHCVRVIEKLLDNGVTSMSEPHRIIKEEFGYSYGIVHAARKKLLQIITNRMRILGE